MDIKIEGNKLFFSIEEQTIWITKKEGLNFLDTFNKELYKVYKYSNRGYKRIKLFEQEDNEQVFFGVYINAKNNLEFDFYVNGEIENIVKATGIEGVFDLLLTLNRFLYVAAK